MLYLFLSLVALPQTPSQGPTTTSHISANVQARPGEYVVTLKPHLSTLKYDPKNLSTTAISKRTWLVRRPKTEPPQVALAALRKDNLIVEPNYIYDSFIESSSTRPNDRGFIDQWGLHNTGQTDTDNQRGRPGVDIQVLKAWKLSTGTPHIVVAVIDSGIDPTHPDLKGNLWINQAERDGQPGVDDDQNGYIDDIHGYDFTQNSGRLIDDRGHGTHVAGIIGAQSNNHRGVTGVAWNVRLMPLRILARGQGGSLANALRAIRYAKSNGAHVVNASWGGGAYSEQLKTAIQELDEIAFIAAAGNSMGNNDRHPIYPASYSSSNLIAVAAADNRGQRSKFTNFGSQSVDVAAPGTGILSTFSNHGYSKLNGTSMAAPHVTGVIALMLSQRQRHATEIKRTLIETSTRLPAFHNRVVSGGLIQARAALDRSK